MGNRSADTNETHQKNLRLPKDLHDEVADLAKRNERSIEAEIRVALRQHVEKATA